MKFLAGSGLGGNGRVYDDGDGGCGSACPGDISKILGFMRSFGLLR